MLKDLSINKIEPSGIIYELLSICRETDNIDITNESLFERYCEGVYLHDGFRFNFDHFIVNNCNNSIVEYYPLPVSYGICDNYEQILKKYSDVLNDPHKNYVIGLSTVSRKYEPSSDGFRYRGWGPYIGTQNPQHEYLYEDIHIDKIYTYHIYEII